MSVSIFVAFVTDQYISKTILMFTKKIRNTYAYINSMIIQNFKLQISLKLAYIHKH